MTLFNQGSFEELFQCAAELFSFSYVTAVWELMIIYFNGPDVPSSFQPRHRRGKSETLRVQYINTKDLRFDWELPLFDSWSQGCYFSSHWFLEVWFSVG